MTPEHMTQRNPEGSAPVQEGMTPDAAARLPYGLLRCTCEKFPKALWANQRMFQLLGLEETDQEWQEFIRENVFFMLPFEERAGFRDDLMQAARRGKPVQVIHAVRTGDGGSRQLTGWVWVAEGPSGEAEYNFSYMPLPESLLYRFRTREAAYQTALEEAYDALFLIDRRKEILECIRTKENIKLSALPGTRILLDQPLRQQFYSFIHGEDRLNAEAFLTRILEGMPVKPEERRLEFRIDRGDTLRHLQVVRVDMDEQYTLVCCREITQERYAQQAMEEMEAIRSINRELDRTGSRQPIRIASYRVVGERVILRSGSNSPGQIREMPLNTFLESCQITREQYRQALEDGKAVLCGGEQAVGRTQQLYAVKLASGAGNYEALLFLYTFGEQRPVEEMGKPRVTIQTFGYFDVLVDGKPVLFHYEKSKEMLAILVDRKGSFVANPYFISCLWENEPYSEKVQNRCRQTAYRLMETLRQYGIEDIVEKVDGRRRIVPERVDCDYFHYIRGDQFGGRPFNGAYMSDYSWGEETLSMLLKSDASRPDWTEQ